MKNVVPPAEIDRELYDKFMTLANDAPDGGAKRQEYLDSLAERLGRESEQYKCAVLRLDESIAHARRLMKDGKVYSAEQWEDHDVQRQIAAPNLANRNQGLDHYDVQLDESKVGDFNDDGEYLSYSNGFFRDFYDMIVGRGLNFEWFK